MSNTQEARKNRAWKLLASTFPKACNPAYESAGAELEAYQTVELMISFAEQEAALSRSAEPTPSDENRLVRELDVIWNGEAGAAKQASLCDVVAQIRNELPKLRKLKSRSPSTLTEEVAVKTIALKLGCADNLPDIFKTIDMFREAKRQLSAPSSSAPGCGHVCGDCSYVHNLWKNEAVLPDSEIFIRRVTGRMIKRIPLFALIFLTGCAANPPHPKMLVPQALGPEQWSCDVSGECMLVRPWEPSQLTPLGCWIHTLVTWKKAEECR